jgi:transcriptional regulator with XRE-family HTH domain
MEIARMSAALLIYYAISIMENELRKDIKVWRPKGLPAEMRRALKEAREKHGWSQRDLAGRLGLTQTHISGIESGKIVPRYDTLLELVRVLGSDILMVPRALVPIVQSLIRDHLGGQVAEGEERSLYADERDEDTPPEPHDEV